MATRNESDSTPPATAPPQVAILIGNGVDGAMVRAMCAVLRKACVWPRLVGQRLGAVASLDACPLQVETTFAGMPPVLLGGVIMPDGAELGRHAGRGPEGARFPAPGSPPWQAAARCGGRRGSAGGGLARPTCCRAAPPIPA
ncbi:hypothetical protein LP419_35910 [Massilia sp. H-1]|nr:hypothetical protein LP419_35910 [Massilia sp. H-1]